MRNVGSAITRWDVAVAARAAGLALGALILAWAITAASDEGGVSWGERAGRALPFAPVCAAVGAWLALAPGRARGEDRALAALGRSPWQRHAGAIVGGAAIAVGCALAIASAPAVDARGFYARLTEPAQWKHVESHFESKEPGRASWEVSTETGEPTRGGQVEPGARAGAPQSVPAHGRLWAALATALTGLGLPMLAARARRRSVAFFALVALSASIVTALAFQASAVGRASPMVVVAAPLALLVFAAWSYRPGLSRGPQERRAPRPG